jgi:hypothetical protein
MKGDKRKNQRTFEYLSTKENGENLWICDAIEWADETMINKACLWLKQNMFVEPIFEYDEAEEPEMYVCASNCDSVDELVDKFRKAMEE